MMRKNLAARLHQMLSNGVELGQTRLTGYAHLLSWLEGIPGDGPSQDGSETASKVLGRAALLPLASSGWLQTAPRSHPVRKHFQAHALHADLSAHRRLCAGHARLQPSRSTDSRAAAAHATSALLQLHGAHLASPSRRSSRKVILFAGSLFGDKSSARRSIGAEIASALARCGCKTTGAAACKILHCACPCQPFRGTPSAGMAERISAVRAASLSARCPVASAFGVPTKLSAICMSSILRLPPEPNCECEASEIVLAGVLLAGEADVDVSRSGSARIPVASMQVDARTPAMRQFKQLDPSFVVSADRLPSSLSSSEGSAWGVEACSNCTDRGSVTGASRVH